MISIDKACSVKNTGVVLAIRDQDAELGQAQGSQAVLQCTQQRTTNSLPAHGLESPEKHNPALFMGGPGNSSSHDFVVDHGDHGVVFFAGGQHLRDGIHRFITGALGFFPQRQESIGVNRMEFANTKSHDFSHRVMDYRLLQIQLRPSGWERT